MSAPAPPAPVAGAQTIDWKGIRVPQPVHYALSAKWRGQKGLDGPKQSAVLSFFVDEPALVKMGQTTMGGGAAPELTPKENVATFLMLKADPANPATRFGPYSYGNINPTRLVELALRQPKVSDDDKEALCAGRVGKAKEWLQAYHEKKQKALADAETDVQTLTQAELAALTPAERDARKRQQTLDERVVTKLTAAQVAAIHYALCAFFFICRIPFAVIEHWSFVAFVKALNPAYAAVMFKRKCLGSTWVKKLRSDTQEKTEAHLDRVVGKKTIIIDGFKDRRGRHVMNISQAKVGFAAYLCTKWFGRKAHDGDTYAKEIQNAVDDGEDFIACVADNTSSNTSMQKGLFGRLFAIYYWFFIGCCVHCLDLLSEDITKLSEFKEILAKFKFITRIILRFSILTETFMFLQKERCVTVDLQGPTQTKLPFAV